MPNKSQPLLSLCIITKDEENRLPSCLQHIKEIADEIIIVDTGSTDNTLQIAKQFGAKTYRKKWTNDFGAARNYALDKAKGKWVLFLDADETILQEEIKQIPPLLDNPMTEGYLFYIDTYLENHEVASHTQALRLFRNRKEYRYQYRVYERIPDEVMTITKETGITIYHQPNPDRHRYMQQLKMDLLKEEIITQPTDSYLRYVYGIELLNKNDYEQSIVHFQEALKYIDNYHIFSPHLYKLLAYSLESIEKYKEVIDTTNEGLIYYPFYTDLVYLRGKAYKELEQYQQALNDFERCMQLGDAAANMVPEVGIGSYKALYLSGQIHEELLNFDTAISFYKQAYKIEKSFTEPLYQVGTILKENPEIGSIDTIFLDLIDSTNPDDLMTLIDILCLEREYEAALKYIEEVTKMIGIREDVAFVKGICYMLMDEGKKAEESFLFIQTDHPFYNQVLLRRIQNYWFNKQWDNANTLLDQLNNAHNIKEQTKKVYHLVHSMLAGGYNSTTIDLDEQGYQTLAKLIEYLLLMKQDVSNNRLLDLLLQAKQEQLWLRIGEIFAANQDGENVLKIYKQIENIRIQKTFREKTAKQFINKNDFKTAEKILQLADSKDYGVLGYYIQHRIWLQKTIEMINTGIRSRKIDPNSKKTLARLKELIINEN